MQVLGSYGRQTPYYYEVGSGILPGATVWEQAPLAAYFSDPAAWVRVMQDFDQITVGTNTIGGWTFTAATTGSAAADATVPNGVLKLDAGAVTAGQGVNFQMNQIPVKLHATLPTVFEARVKWTALTSLKVQTFIGLSAINTAIIAANALSTSDSIGFAGVTTTGVIGATTSSTTTTTNATTKTIANATYYRWGIVATTSAVAFYVDGVLLCTNTLTIPTTALSPSFVCQANATVQPVMHLDYVQVLSPRA